MRPLVLALLLATCLAPLAAPPAAACHPEGPEPDPNHHGCGGNVNPLRCLDPKVLVSCLPLP